MRLDFLSSNGLALACLLVVACGTNDERDAHASDVDAPGMEVSGKRVRPRFVAVAPRGRSIVVSTSDTFRSPVVSVGPGEWAESPTAPNAIWVACSWVVVTLLDQGGWVVDEHVILATGLDTEGRDCGKPLPIPAGAFAESAEVAAIRVHDWHDQVAPAEMDTLWRYSLVDGRRLEPVTLKWKTLPESNVKPIGILDAKAIIGTPLYVVLWHTSDGSSDGALVEVVDRDGMRYWTKERSNYFDRVRREEDRTPYAAQRAGGVLDLESDAFGHAYVMWWESSDCERLSAEPQSSATMPWRIMSEQNMIMGRK